MPSFLFAALVSVSSAIFALPCGESRGPKRLAPSHSANSRSILLACDAPPRGSAVQVSPDAIRVEVVLLPCHAEYGRQHARENPRRPLPATLLPKTTERKQRRNSPCGKSYRVACTLGTVAELQNSADDSEPSSNGKRGNACSADCAVPLGAQDVSQLDDLRPLVIDAIQNVLDIERCNCDGLADVLAERQFIERHARGGADVFRGCQRGKPRDKRLNANYMRCLQGIWRELEAIDFLAAWVCEANMGRCTYGGYDLGSA